MHSQMYEHISKSRLNIQFWASAFLAPDVMSEEQPLFPFPKDERDNSGTTSHCPTWEIVPHKSRHGLETALQRHQELLFIPTILCITWPLQALPLCKTNYKWCRYPIEDLCLLAMHPFLLLMLWLHILFREWPCGGLNDWPQLSAPFYIHTLCHVILLFLLLEARNISQPQGCWAWHCDLFWVNVSESNSVLVWVGFKSSRCPLSLYLYHHYQSPNNRSLWYLNRMLVSTT